MDYLHKLRRQQTDVFNIILEIPHQLNPVHVLERNIKKLIYMNDPQLLK